MECGFLLPLHAFPSTTELDVSAFLDDVSARQAKV
jgi:hypothetical protein